MSVSNADDHMGGAKAEEVLSEGNAEDERRDQFLVDAQIVQQPELVHAESMLIFVTEDSRTRLKTHSQGPNDRRRLGRGVAAFLAAGMVGRISLGGDSNNSMKQSLPPPSPLLSSFPLLTHTVEPFLSSSPSLSPRFFLPDTTVILL